MRHSLAKLIGFCAQLFVAQGFVFGFKRIDLHHCFAVLLDQAVIATAEEFGQKIDRHSDTGLKLPKIAKTSPKILS